MNKIIAKLLKLIEHQKSAEEIGSALEAQAFAAKVNDLLHKHKLEMSDVEYFAYTQTNDFNALDVHLSGKRRQYWVQELATVIGATNGCVVIVYPNKTSFTYCGRKYEIEFCEKLFRYLYDFAQCERRRYKSQRSYCNGFVAAVAKRLWERYQATQQTAVVNDTASSQALVRISSDVVKATEYAKTFIQDNYAKEQKETRLKERNTDVDSYLQGLNDGNRVSITINRLTPGTERNQLNG